MRILLPPSEAKSPGGSGPAWRDLPADGTPLTATRRTVLDAVRRLCAERPDLAVELLRLPPAVAEAALASNRVVDTSPTVPALGRFTGVLFDAFSPGTLPRAARRRAEESVLVFDGAFGVLEGGEPVPDHRVPAAASLPDLGGVSTLWRPTLSELLPERVAGHLVVDLRSSDYAAMWRPARGLAAEVVPVRILVEQPGPSGSRYVVSSVPSKVGKGLLARALCTTRNQLRSVRDLRRVAEGAGFRVVDAGKTLDLLFDFVPRGAEG